MPIGLSDREAAAIVGLSHVAVGNARRSKRLPTLPDGSVSREALLKWNSERRAPRGGKRQDVTAGPQGVTASLEAMRAAIPLGRGGSSKAAEAAMALLTEEGVFADRADAERYRDSYVARLRQIEFEEKAGKLLPADAVTAAISSACAKVRTRLLAIPAEQAPAIHRLKTVVEIQDALHQVVTDALTELVISFRPQ